MRLTASDFYTYHRPSLCPLRVYKRLRGEAEAAPGPYDQVIRRLGERHEKAHLATLPAAVDLSGGARLEREQRTKEEVARGAPAIYQAALRSVTSIDGIECEVIGDPDFLIAEPTGYRIRDSKISRRITEKDHCEILRQVELYGWLFEQVFGKRPLRLEVHSGTGDLVEIPYDGGHRALDGLREILALKRASTEHYSPVGWSKCDRCPFYHHCWPRAEANRDVALVAGLDQGLAIGLREIGVMTYDDLLGRFDEATLAEFSRPWGKGKQRVGKRAASILRMARALATQTEILLEPPLVPAFPNYVMFDLEGLPPQMDELEKVYLWGLQVYGKQPGEFRAATAGFGPAGDRQGWDRFLQEAGTMFNQYGDLPFVHWHHYERVRLDMYVDRYGDPKGVAGRVRQNLLDLLPVAQRSIALPLPSYSLKVIEKYIGFKRTQEEYGGDWAMAKYIEATEIGDEKQRADVMEQILLYNKEDLQATWEVLRWLRARGAQRT